MTRRIATAAPFAAIVASRLLRALGRRSRSWDIVAPSRELARDQFHAALGRLIYAHKRRPHRSPARHALNSPLGTTFKERLSALVPIKRRRLGGATRFHVCRGLMTFRDTKTGYGLVSRLAHWLMAVAIVAMFALGLWMVGLDYYSPYYKSAPDLHRSAGILLLIALLARFAWRVVNVKPDDSELSPFERRASAIVHWGFYPLLLALMVSGYLISTLDGRAIDVFGLFSAPSIIEAKGWEDTAGLVHEVLAYATMALASVHTLAALKHHVIDKHATLVRMWSGPA